MRRLLAISTALLLLATGCGSGDDDTVTLTVYSGRSEQLVQPLYDQFTAETGIEVAVRYAGSAELAATLIEEGANSPADVFFAQDPASLGVVAAAGLLSVLPDDVLALVPDRFSDDGGRWIGTSGRSRVMAYDATKIDPADLPTTVDELTAPEWAGRVALAPTNASFLAFVAAQILLEGEDATRQWLDEMAANGSPTFPDNSAIVAAIDDGAVETGLVNHYYLYRRIDELGDAVVVRNHYLTGAGGLVMPAGAGILRSSEQQGTARQLIEFLLSESAQHYFAEQTFEYPLAAGVPALPEIPPLDTLDPPDLDLSRLAGVQDRATELVAEAGLL